MARGRSNWVVEIDDHRGEEPALYGPYTRRQAEATVRHIRRHIARELRAKDQDSTTTTVSCYPLSPWKPWEIEAEPARPPCPLCGAKLGVWTSQFTDETFGCCNNDDCRGGEWTLEERDGRWVVADDDR